MINISSICSDFTALLRANTYFDDFYICQSFPRTVKPTLFSHPAVAVKLSGMNVDEASLGNDVAAGEVSVSAVIFIPSSLKNQLSADEIIAKICACAAGMRIVRLKCYKPYNEKISDCYAHEIIITFNDEICFEEQS